MKTIYKNTKFSTITLITMLTISAILVAIPIVKAQTLIMNVGNQGILNFKIDVDLNGPNEQYEGMNFAYKPPGATEFIHTTDPIVDNEPGLPGERYVTDPGGDLDIDWTPTDGAGDYEVKWVLNSSNIESNVVTITVVKEILSRTYAFIGATPNPVGVGEQVLFHVGISHQTAGIAYSWEGLTVTIEKPDGTTDTLTNINTDATGGTGVSYIPTMVGTHYVQTHFPEQMNPRSVAGTSAGATMLASDSAIIELIVQEEPLPYWPGAPLPAEYWTRPINAQLWEWSGIAGDWLDPRGYFESVYVPYNDDAPETAHILWTKPLATGGLAGGDNLLQSYEDGGAYQDKFKSSVIIAGVLYYNNFESQGGNNVEQIVTAVDLHTGEEKWSKPLIDSEGNVRRLSFGQAFYWDSYNYHGVFGYLWATSGSTWHAFDAFSGRWVYSMEGVPGGITVYGSSGEIYKVNVNTRSGTISQWNSSRVVSNDGSWRPHGNVYEDSDERGLDWEVTIPTGLAGSAQSVVLGDKVFGASVTWTEVSSWAISLKEGQEGQLLFKNTWDAPAEWNENFRSGHVRLSAVSLADGVFTVFEADTREHYGFSTTTGDLLWGPTAPEHYLMQYAEGMANIEYGKLLSGSMAGIIYCYDVTTGELLWEYAAVDPYAEVTWSNNFPLRAPAALVVNGKLYGGYGEHSPIDPKPRGAPFFCIDMETGEEIFRVSIAGASYSQTALIGDSIISILNAYDQQIYSIGKGPSATTVSVAPKVMALGTSVLIEGTITDISPGTEKYALTARFPSGVPAIADENMSPWMEYIYMQQPKPTDATGVEVVLSVLDSNNNIYEIGRTTSNIDGSYGLMWAPPISGQYEVRASFEGSESYWGSYANTYIGVIEAPQPTPEPTSTPGPQTETFITGSTIAILAGIAVAIFLILRKK